MKNMIGYTLVVFSLLLNTICQATDQKNKIEDNNISIAKTVVNNIRGDHVNDAMIEKVDAGISSTELKRVLQGRSPAREASMNNVHSNLLKITNLGILPEIYNKSGALIHDSQYSDKDFITSHGIVEYSESTEGSKNMVRSFDQSVAWRILGDGSIFVVF